jgi:hypothetical protein
MKKLLIAAMIAVAAVAVPAAGVLADETTTQLSAELSGINGQSGSAEFTLDAATGSVCYEIDVSDLTAPVFAAHIHLGATGGIVVPLFFFSPPTTADEFSGCVSASPTLVAAIAADPGAYYVNVHTTLQPGGAVRGTLTGED